MQMDKYRHNYIVKMLVGIASYYTYTQLYMHVALKQTAIMRQFHDQLRASILLSINAHESPYILASNICTRGYRVGLNCSYTRVLDTSRASECDVACERYCINIL